MSRTAAARRQLTRYVNCLKCGRIELKLVSDFMRCNVACPTCGCPDAFGPDVWVDDYKGKTLRQAMNYQQEKCRHGFRKEPGY